MTSKPHWEPITSPVCQNCKEFSGTLYLCIPHEAKKCLTCLYQCQEFLDWIDLVVDLGFKLPILRTFIWDDIYGADRYKKGT